MKIKLIGGVIVLLTVILINACEDKKGALPSTAIENCDTTNLTYSSDTNSMQAIINVQCAVNNTSCHSPYSASGYDYSTYAGIYSNYQNGLLYGGLFGNLPRMPLTPQLGWNPSCMLPKFKAWMNRGCPK